jgi:hypothetical protein
MTLAEIFLLLLIVGWYASRLESESLGTDPGGPIAQLSKQLEETKKQLARAEAEKQAQESLNRQLEGILEWIAKTVGFAKPIDSVEDAKRALEEYGDAVAREARRGKPKCRPDNILVDVLADAGAVSVTLRQGFANASAAYSPGQRLSDRTQINGLLSAVERFYNDPGRQEPAGCVFDYSLSWRGDSDYRSGREQFERYFYPAGLRQIR